MPRESINLKLKLYNAVEDAKEFAIDWFNNVFDYANSNWTKIDDAYKELKDEFNNHPKNDGAGATGNWDISVKNATNDSAGQQIDATYIKNIAPSDDKIIITKGNNETSIIDGAAPKGYILTENMSEVSDVEIASENLYLIGIIHNKENVTIQFDFNASSISIFLAYDFDKNSMAGVAVESGSGKARLLNKNYFLTNVLSNGDVEVYMNRIQEMSTSPIRVSVSLVTKSNWNYILKRSDLVLEDAVSVPLIRNANRTNIVPIEIPTTGWSQDDNSAYPNYIDIEADDIASSDCVALVISPNSNAIAKKCYFASTESLDKKIRVRCRNIPAETLLAFYYVIQEDIMMAFGQTPIGGVILPPATKTELGGIKAGNGLSIESDGTLNLLQDEILKVISSNNIFIRNSIYRGKDITPMFENGTLFEKIGNASFEDLYVGDYFVATCGDVTTKWRLGGFDTYYNYGSPQLTKHHAVVIPDDPLATANMNSTAIVTGGYAGSRMYTETMPDLSTKIATMIGESHLIKYSDVASSQTNDTIASGAISNWTGASTSWKWDTNTTVRLCGEMDVYGCRALSSSFYDDTLANGQLPLFRLNPSLIALTKYTDGWWLSSVASSTRFCAVGVGGITTSIAANATGNVRPRFLID